MRELSILFAVTLCAAPALAGAAGATEVASSSASPLERLLVLDAQDDTSPLCYKICSKGKPCGDSCISRSLTCRKGQGCASDG